MLFLKGALLIIGIVAVLVPIAIYLMLKKPGSFKSYKEMVRNQYPSLFHRDKTSNHS